MKPRVALVVGCNNYKHLPILYGAATDASRMHEVIVAKNMGGYDKSLSKLLLSPTLAEFISALNDALFRDDGLDVFTLFFAGHGGVKSGSYYLCFPDSRVDRMSATAHPLNSLFTALNESRPTQVNIIIDACSAGGLVGDLGTLLKPDLIGLNNSPSISLLAAASADEYASETNEGGVVTTLLVDYLSGKKKLNSTSPYLDLSEIGRAVSISIDQGHQQTPTSWALNLYGHSKFSLNPHYSEHESPIPVGLFDILPASEIGKKIAEHSEALWDEYRALGDEPDPYRLATALRPLISEIAHAPGSVAAFVSGISTNLEQRAATSQDLFGPVAVISTLLALLLEFSYDETVQLTTTRLLDRRRVLIKECLTSIEEAQKQDKYHLLSSRDIGADLFLLPIRLCKLLGYFWSQVLIDDVSGSPDAILNSRIVTVTEETYKHYSSSFVAVSDEQAPYVYLIAQAASRAGATSAVAEPLSRIFQDFVHRKGHIADAHMEEANTFRFLMRRSSGTEGDARELLANPSHLGAVMLSMTTDAATEEQRDRTLRALDHHSIGIFIPESFLHFGYDLMHGVNNVFQIGRGIWSMKDFRTEFIAECVPALHNDPSWNAPSVQALAIIAALVFPDRIPWFLEVRELATL
jgi:hypothetical protein